MDSFKVWVLKFAHTAEATCHVGRGSSRISHQGAGIKGDCDKYPSDGTQITEGGLNMEFLIQVRLAQAHYWTCFSLQVSFYTLCTSKRKIYLNYYLKHNC